MIKTAVARRYAKALLGLLDRPAVPATREALRTLGDAIRRTPSLTHVMASPAFSPEEKIAVLVSLSERLKAPPMLGRFLAQLVKTNRVAFLPEIAEAFAVFADREAGILQVSVTAAQALTSMQQTRLRDRLRQTLKQEVHITFGTDPSLVSGLQIRVGSMVYDSTVRTRLTELRTILTKES